MINTEYDNLGRLLRDGTQGGPQFQKPYWTAPMPYRILRQPTATSDPPYQLPEGTAIDLRASGWGDDDYFYRARTAATIVDPVHHHVHARGARRASAFQPKAICRRHPVDLFDEPVVDNVFLLVGKRENIPAPLPGNDVTLNVSNWSAAHDRRGAAGSQGADQLAQRREPLAGDRLAVGPGGEHRECVRRSVVAAGRSWKTRTGATKQIRRRPRVHIANGEYGGEIGMEGGGGVVESLVVRS